MPAHRVLLALTALTAALLATLVGCDRSPPPAATNTPPPLPEVRLGYFANITHAQAVLGVSSGDFQAALGPTKLTTSVFNAGPALIQALNAKLIDIGYVGPGPVISADVNSRGQAVRVISGAASNGVVIVASKTSGIHSLKDLKDKRIATPQLGNTQDVSARHFVTEILGEADADNVKEVKNSQQAGLMSRGSIDAAWIPEPWGARLIEETGAILIAEEKDLWPDHRFALTVIVTSPDFLAAHPEVIEKILTVHHAWTQRLTADPMRYADQLNDALQQLGGIKISSSIMRDALARTQFIDDPLQETFITMEKWSRNLKFISSAPDLANLFDNTIMTKVLAAPLLPDASPAPSAPANQP